MPVSGGKYLHSSGPSCTPFLHGSGSSSNGILLASGGEEQASETRCRWHSGPIPPVAEVEVQSMAACMAHLCLIHTYMVLLRECRRPIAQISSGPHQLHTRPYLWYNRLTSLFSPPGRTCGRGDNIGCWLDDGVACYISR